MHKSKIRITLILMVLLSILAIFPSVVKAAETTYTATSTINGVTVNWSYELNETNEIEELTCTNISDLSGNITIPATIDGKKIISIGGYAFRGAINITEVTIPDSVEKIGINAFENCTNLTKVNLPEGLKEFGWNVFEGCTGLTEFTIPKNVTSAQSIFKGCTNLTKVIFEDGIKVIPAYVCSGVKGITEVTIPDSVEKIGINAFENCTNLTKVNLPEGLKEFGWNVFEGCTGLTEFTIPKNVTSAQSIFKGCTNLTKVIFEDGIKVIPAYVCSGVKGITEVTIPDSVEKIGINAFENCTNLKKITILDNVKDMGWGMAQSDDTVFVNHNDDLTIYCYEDSMAANYAIKYNIKYVYLTKPATDDNVNNEEKPKDEIPNTTKPTQKPVTDKEDTTTATGKLPQTGLSMGMTLAIIVVLAGGVFAYFKYSKLRGI